ncbi:MAG: hypothetical protein ABSB32_10325 [Thermodesulfobacteriota bacterium]
MRGPRAPAIPLKRRGKTVCGAWGTIHRTLYDRKARRVRDLSCGDMRVYSDLEIRGDFWPRCQKVKQEKLDWLATLCSHIPDRGQQRVR